MSRHLDRTDELQCQGRFATPEELEELAEHLNTPVKGSQRQAALHTAFNRVTVAHTLKIRSDEPSTQS